MAYSIRSAAVAIFLALLIFVPEMFAEEPQPQDKLSEAERAVRTIPTKIAGTYKGGELVELRV